MVHDRRSIMPHTRHRLLQWVVHPPPDAAPPAALLIRLMAGGVFVGEGLLKWLFPATLGVGRFSALGIPAPALMAPLVGGVEIVGGMLFLLGWCTRLAAIALILDLVVAILSTIIPRWLGTSLLPPLGLPPVGLPALLYDVRTDVAQLLGAILLCLGGAGPWALDALLASPREGGALMKDVATADAIAALVEDAAIQDALVHHRLALAWGHQVCTQLLQTWTALEAYEPLAYEDKVAGQLHVLEEATRSLWPLHQRLVQARRLLHRHRQHLQCRKTL